MKPCLRCKRQNPDDANYCRHCGFPLESDRELILKKAISSFEGTYRQMIQELEEKNRKIDELSRLCESSGSTRQRTNTLRYLEAVDLGLSVGWASCNLGAESPEEFGNYYAWGEISPKVDYSWDTYLYSDANGKRFSKYNMTAGGPKDYKTRLDYSDDAARKTLGDGWRMPGKNEIIELKNRCQWTWTRVGNVFGYSIYSKKTGKSIFLPASGYYDGIQFNNCGVGYYLMNTPCLDSSPCALVLTIEKTSFDIKRYNRYYGFSIRPVKQ